MSLAKTKAVKAKADPKDEKIKQLEFEISELKNSLDANNMANRSLYNDYVMSTDSYLDDMKRLMLRLRGVCYIDAITMAAAKDSLLTINIEYDKVGGVTYTLIKQKDENEK